MSEDGMKNVAINASFFSNHVGKRSDAGFTFAEILVVIAIIAILVTIALPSLFQFTDEAKYCRIAEELRILDKAAALFMTTKAEIPSDLSALVSAGYIANSFAPPAGYGGASSEWYEINSDGRGIVRFIGRAAGNGPFTADTLN